MEYKIQPNDNLTKIAQANGTTVEDLLRLNPSIKNKNLIQAGASLILPDKNNVNNTDAGLKGTLPNEKIADSTAEKKLPTSTISPLNALTATLKMVSDRAISSGMKTGLKTTFGSLESAGIKTENASGSLTDKIIDFVSGQTKEPIQDTFTTMKATVEGISNQQSKLKDDARNQITQAISSGMWNKMDDNQRGTLWSAAGYTGNPIMAKDDNVEYYHTTDDSGNVWNVGFDKSTGAIMTKTNLGKIGSSDSTKNKAEPSQTIASILDKVVGADGKVSPQDYNDAKKTWTTYYNLDAKDFDSKFSQYRDPANASYDITLE